MAYMSMSLRPAYLLALLGTKIYQMASTADEHFFIFGNLWIPIFASIICTIFMLNPFLFEKSHYFSCWLACLVFEIPLNDWRQFIEQEIIYCRSLLHAIQQNSLYF